MPGRNDPCPCGSGRKYKHCCLPQEKRIPGLGDPGLDEVWEEFDTRPVEKYLGLTRHQTDLLINEPFSHPDLLRISERVAPPDDLPLVIVLDELRREFVEGRPMPIEKDRSLSLELASRIADRLEEQVDWQLYFPPDIDPGLAGQILLAVTHDLLELSGVFTPYRGQFRFGNRWENAVRQRHYSTVFPHVYKKYVADLDWICWNQTMHDPLQRYAGFTLYQLALFDRSDIDVPADSLAVYSITFFEAFEELVHELADGGDAGDLQVDLKLLARYVLHVAHRHWAFTGLAEFRIPDETEADHDQLFPVKATPLFHELVSFPILDEV